MFYVIIQKYVYFHAQLKSCCNQANKHVCVSVSVRLSVPTFVSVLLKAYQLTNCKYFSH